MDERWDKAGTPVVQSILSCSEKGVVYNQSSTCYKIRMAFALFEFTTRLLLLLLVGYQLWQQLTVDRRAADRVARFRGEKLPPLNTLKEFSVSFRIALLPYYRREALKEREQRRLRRSLTEGSRASTGTPINPATEPDCPECANGLPHETCRDGWREALNRRAESAP